MLDVSPTEIHGAIPIAKPRLIYGAMLFRMFFLEAIMGVIWDAFLDVNWYDNWDDNYEANWDAN